MARHPAITSQHTHKLDEDLPELLPLLRFLVGSAGDYDQKAQTTRQIIEAIVSIVASLGMKWSIAAYITHEVANVFFYLSTVESYKRGDVATMQALEEDLAIARKRLRDRLRRAFVELAAADEPPENKARESLDEGEEIAINAKGGKA